MRKLFCMLLCAAIVLSVDAWGDTQTKAVAVAKVGKVKKCLFPKSRKRAPNWVCNAHVDGLATTAVGSSAKSDAGIAFMQQMAAADARAHLAQNLHGPVQNKIKSSNASMAPDERDSTLITRIINESLRDTKIVKSIYGPDGTLYVLVGLNGARTKELVDSISADYLAQKRK
jgi:hypothetical protein